MIESVHFKYFRALRDVSMTLTPLTVLVGPNSSGKTSVLAGLNPRFSVSSRVASHNVPIIPPSDYWKQNPTDEFGIQWQYGGNRSGRLSRRPGFTIGHKTQPLTLDLQELRSENVLAYANSLSPTGGNLTNVFSTLTRQQQASVANELCRLVPMFSDVDLIPTQSGKHQLRFQDRWNADLWLTPSQVSDGTMLILAFLVLQYQPDPADLITIEEPERALHPYLLDELIQLIRKMTTGEIGKKPVQFVLATHSAELLEYVRPEEVRFLTRAPEDGSVQVNEAPTGSTNWQQVYKEYRESLGSIWLSGNVGGVPGR
ncbi:AAA family ATPase [Stigmatella sp. ncwal1]|uniref:AAA family ATPase n=1 Tax=Stigmatella ashevillensis TaxID=2995309 RepID=A0ABT5DHZ8_9BACT|nr:AAA family ATPase [Stigmatella ashevillena]MDC0711962.1 AAA family ATPase [Stigmatella ashevillena]